MNHADEDCSSCRHGSTNESQKLPPEGEDLDRMIDELFDTVQVPPEAGFTPMAANGDQQSGKVSWHASDIGFG